MIIIIAGFGGQGALRIGQIIAQAAIRKGLEAEWLPSYGAEMRGGTANCHVTISDREITFPMIKHADTCIIMNDLSLDKFEQSLVPGGILIINSDIVTKKITRKNIEIIDADYGDGITVTSAMKGLETTVDTVLTDIKGGKWGDYAGKIENLGLVSENPDENFVKLPMESTQWGDGFTEEDYKALVADMYSGKVTVDAVDRKSVV